MAEKYEAACSRLASEAVRKLSADNVTVMLVHIANTRWHQPKTCWNLLENDDAVEFWVDSESDSRDMGGWGPPVLSTQLHDTGVDMNVILFVAENIHDCYVCFKWASLPICFSHPENKHLCCCQLWYKVIAVKLVLVYTSLTYT